jgi:hypothetical protein
MKMNKSSENVGGWIVVGARFFFTWSLVLLVIEIITLFGASEQIAKILDLFAILFTIILLLFTTIGLRLYLKWQSKRERTDN